MDIEGLGDKTVELLVEKKILTTILDIYNLSHDRLKHLEGFGQKTIDNLLEAIKVSTECTMNKFIYALGIPNVGENTSKILAKNYPDLLHLESASFDELKNLKDIGPISAKSIVDFVNSKQFVLVRTLYLHYLNVKHDEVHNTKLDNKRFVITGSFDEMNREDIKALIESNGGSVASSVSATVNYLIAGESAGSKLQQAKSKNIHVIDLNTFKEMISK
jgi:DNA ligase (NAD+)